MNNSLVRRLVHSCAWRIRRYKFAATHEWLRSAPYALRYGKYRVLYNPGNALAERFILSGCYEKDVLEYLRSSLKSGAVVADVGANIGFFTLSVLEQSAGARVHAFEPSPESFALLSSSLAQNNVAGQVVANQVALYSEAGEMDFQIHAARFGAYDGFRDTGYAGVPAPRTIKVPVTTIDLYAKRVRLDRLDLLKIDVEGAELFVLRGAREVLSTLRPTVLFEVGYQNLRPFGLLPADLYREFEEIGYRVMSIHRDALTEAEFGHACIDQHEYLAEPRR